MDLGKLAEQSDHLETKRLINAVFNEALTNELSEIHFDPFEDELLIRGRQHGELYECRRLTPENVGAWGLPFKDVVESITNRLKIMGRLDLAERRLFQDGRIHVKLPNDERGMEIGISTIPTTSGDKICLHVLQWSTQKLGLKGLGMDTFAEGQLMEAIEKTGGMLIFAGPTGSGKTTMQCSILWLLNDGKKNILTAEWPVEYYLPGVNQVDCKFDIGYTDAVAMRAFLEQNPDVIMVKLEDRERSELAFRAAEIDALVLGAMHVNCGAEVFDRLRNMGITKFDLSTYVLLVQAQRTVRRLCLDCKKEYSPSPGLLRNLKIDEQLIQRLGLANTSPTSITFYKHHGCETCSGSGYVGRALLCESLKVTPRLQNLILQGSKAEAIEKAAIEEGMITLRQAGLRQVILGNTTLEQVMMVT